DRVDLVSWDRGLHGSRGNPRAGSCGCTREVDLAEVVGERLERFARLGDERNRRGLAGRLVTKVERVVDELAPEPAHLRHVVLREEVLAERPREVEVVEDAIADVPRRRTALHR